MFDLINKLADVKKKMDEIKARLDLVTVDGIAGNGKVKVTATGNRKVKSIVIDDSLMGLENKEELLDLLEIATNDALTKAENVSEGEMKSAGRDFLPGFPGF
jgi:DNA-binding YbaB/EbfC family protein